MPEQIINIRVKHTTGAAYNASFVMNEETQRGKVLFDPKLPAELTKACNFFDDNRDLTYKLVNDYLDCLGFQIVPEKKNASFRERFDAVTKCLIALFRQV